jgi:hypothetical protein
MAVSSTNHAQMDGVVRLPMDGEERPSRRLLSSGPETLSSVASGITSDNIRTRWRQKRYCRKCAVSAARTAANDAGIGTAVEVLHYSSESGDNDELAG